MRDEFHKPFLFNLVYIVFITVFAMISSHYATKYYSQYASKNSQVLIYTGQQSEINNKQ